MNEEKESVIPVKESAHDRFSIRNEEGYAFDVSVSMYLLEDQNSRWEVSVSGGNGSEEFSGTGPVAQVVLDTEKYMTSVPPALVNKISSMSTALLRQCDQQAQAEFSAREL